MTIIEHYHNKDMYPKLVLNKLKIIWDSTFIYTHYVPNLEKLHKKLSAYLWPMFIHVQQCVVISIHVRINSELWVN
jgi:hypothetical protein